jgi:hypothetical protein
LQINIKNHGGLRGNKSQIFVWWQHPMAMASSEALGICHQVMRAMMYLEIELL